MKDNKYLAWTAFVLFILSAGLILLFVLLATVFSDVIENPGVIVVVIGAFSLLGTIMGFLAFKAPQARVGAIGGLVILLLVLFITPVGRSTSITQPQPDADVQEQTGHTGIEGVDTVIDTVLGGDQKDVLQLLHFSTLACTHAEGLGGPPKCREGEEEGTKVEAFPFLGPEGHHMRKNETDGWTGIRATGVYAVYRLSEQVYSDENFPAGEYAIVFLDENDELSVYITHVTDGKIIRIDYVFGSPSEIDLERDAAEIILAPQR